VVEHPPCKRKVVSSILTGGSIELRLFFHYFKKVKPSVSSFSHSNSHRPTHISRHKIRVPKIWSRALSRLMKELLTMKDIRELLGLGRTAGYALINQPDFPAPISISTKTLRWVASEVMGWLESQKGRKPRTIKRVRSTSRYIEIDGAIFRSYS
jgi:prophage regulatory protein